MTEQETRRALPLECRGQADVARWCGVSGAAVANWIKRHPDDFPAPNVVVRNEGEDSKPIRGWLPERRAEWEAFAAERKTSAREPGNAAASRARRTAEMIRQGAEEGRIDPAEAVRLLSELI